MSTDPATSYDSPTSTEGGYPPPFSQEPQTPAYPYPPATPAPSMDQTALRRLAIKKVKKKRALKTNVFSFLVVNAFFIFIWLLTGAGHFWPGWIIAAWGIGLAFQAKGYFEEEITEDEIQKEMIRLQSQRKR